jgi:hypothetical protein
MENQDTPKTGHAEENYRYVRRHSHGALSGVGGGVFLVLLGVLLFLANQSILGWDRWWQFLIIGIGIIILIDTLIRYQRDKVLEFRVGRLIAAIILIGVGIAFLLGSVVWWPLVIILVGVAVIIGGLLRRGRNREE